MPYVLQFGSAPANLMVSRSPAPAVVYGDEFSNGADKIRRLSLLMLDRMARSCKIHVYMIIRLHYTCLKKCSYVQQYMIF